MGIEEFPSAPPPLHRMVKRHAVFSFYSDNPLYNPLLQSMRAFRLERPIFYPVLSILPKMPSTSSAVFLLSPRNSCEYTPYVSMSLL